MGMLRRTAMGLVAGFIATAVMNTITSWFYQVEPEAEKRKEREASSENAAHAAARYVGGTPGIPGPDETQMPMSTGIHWVYGTLWGGLYGLVSPWMRALRWSSGVAYGMFVWVVGDEAIPAGLRMSPSPTRLPLMSHLRGLTGHLAFGATVAIVYRGLDSRAPGGPKPLRQRVMDRLTERWSDLPTERIVEWPRQRLSELPTERMADWSRKMSDRSAERLQESRLGRVKDWRVPGRK